MPPPLYVVRRPLLVQFLPGPWRATCVRARKLQFGGYKGRACGALLWFCLLLSSGSLSLFGPVCPSLSLSLSLLVPFVLLSLFPLVRECAAPFCGSVCLFSILVPDPYQPSTTYTLLTQQLYLHTHTQSHTLFFYNHTHLYLFAPRSLLITQTHKSPSRSPYHTRPFKGLPRSKSVSVIFLPRGGYTERAGRTLWLYLPPARAALEDSLAQLSLSIPLFLVRPSHPPLHPLAVWAGAGSGLPARGAFRGVLSACLCGRHGLVKTQKSTAYGSFTKRTEAVQAAGSRQRGRGRRGRAGHPPLVLPAHISSGVTRKGRAPSVVD